jgi:hypothetical protein
VALSSLHHVIDLEWMKEAYRLTRKDGAPMIKPIARTHIEKMLGFSLPGVGPWPKRR